jgi:Microsomal signal peptidase 25 kDa subunit (SPC25)
MFVWQTTTEQSVEFYPINILVHRVNTESSSSSTMGKKKSANQNSHSTNTTPAVVPVVAAVAAVIEEDDCNPTLQLDDADTVTTVNTHNPNTTGTCSSNDDTVVVYELLQVDVGDMIKVKQVLDECVAMIVLDYLPEDTQYDNGKLLIMSLACIAAMVAQMQQYSNVTLPENRFVIATCGILYFLCSTLLQAITTFVDQDTIVWTQPITTKTIEQRQKQQQKSMLLMNMMNSSSSSSSASSNSNDPNNNSSSNSNSNNNMYRYYNPKTKTYTSLEPISLTNPLLTQYGARIRTSLPRFSQYYTVTLEYQIPKPTTSPDKTTSGTSNSAFAVSQTWSIGNFFDTQGYFDEIGLAHSIEELLWTQFNNVVADGSYNDNNNNNNSNTNATTTTTTKKTGSNPKKNM